MGGNQQPRACYGVLVRVHDLTRLRAFYRDTLELGEPVVDSNVWTEFAVPGNGILVLSQAANCPAGAKNGPAWLFHVDDFDGTVKRLHEAEVPTVHPTVDLPGCRAATFADPEGNAFTVYACA